jgi:SAM-dependent methyltransferase
MVGEAARAPFDAERFDVVVAVTILCFVADACPVLREMARVLRPGGTLIIGELGKWSLWAAVRRIRAWFGSNLWRRGRFRTGGELRYLASQAGLKPGPVLGSIYYPRWQRAVRLLAAYDSSFGRLTNYSRCGLSGAFRRKAGAQGASPQSVFP